MASAFDEARAWVRRSREHLPKIANLHAECLKTKKISDDFAMEVSETLGGFRTALDYCVADLQDRFGKRGDDSHFPICDDAKSFEKKIAAKLPRLPPAAVCVLRSVQPYSHPSNRWIEVVRTENNSAKHATFAAHEEGEARDFAVKDADGNFAILVKGNSSLRIAPGSRIAWGGVHIEGGPDGVEFAAGKPIPAIQRGTLEVRSWRFLFFKRSKMPVLEVIAKAIAGTGNIVERLAAI